MMDGMQTANHPPIHLSVQPRANVKKIKVQRATLPLSQQDNLLVAPLRRSCNPQTSKEKTLTLTLKNDQKFQLSIAHTKS